MTSIFTPPLHKRKYITFICTGNICRSPMAERLLQQELKSKPEPLNSLKVISTGLYASGNMPASEKAVALLKKSGIDLTDHRSQPLTQAIIDQSLALFVMTEQHRQSLKQRFKKTTPYVYLTREFLGNSKEVEVADPYGSSLEAYEVCRDDIVESIPSIMGFLERITTPMTISLGSDHRGVSLRKSLIQSLSDTAYQVIDHGTNESDSVDYPDFARPVAEDVASGKADYGVLICCTGIGMSISANKVKGARAALLHNRKDTVLSRAHNDANIICFGDLQVTPDEAHSLLHLFLSTPFHEGRHQRRVDKIERD